MNDVCIVGIGNTLRVDDGVGQHALRQLESYDFTPTITLHDCGTAPHRLLTLLPEFDHTIILECVDAGVRPGTVMRLNPDEVSNLKPGNSSLHNLGPVEVLSLFETLGQNASLIIIGVQPDDIDGWGTKLSPAVEAALPEMIDLVLEEITALGISVA